MSKGSSKQAANEVGIDNSYADQYNKSATGVGGQLTPFLENELKDPQGYGQEELSKMQTEGGQAVSGATGAADEAATLAASRTGNPASTAGVIDATARNAMKQQSSNALDIASQDALLKQKQQQSGAAGLESMYGTDVGASLKSLGLADDSLNAWTNAKAAADKNTLDWTKLGLNTLASPGPAAALGV